MNLEQLKEVIVAALPNCNPDAVTLEAQIVPDVCADSLDTVELSMAIEDKLGVSMPDGLMATMLTIGDLLKYLQENKSALLPVRNNPNGLFNSFRHAYGAPPPSRREAMFFHNDCFKLKSTSFSVKAL